MIKATSISSRARQRLNFQKRGGEGGANFRDSCRGEISFDNVADIMVDNMVAAHLELYFFITIELGEGDCAVLWHSPTNVSIRRAALTSPFVIYNFDIMFVQTEEAL